MQIDSTSLGLAQTGQTAQTAAAGDTTSARGHHRHSAGGDEGAAFRSRIAACGAGFGQRSREDRPFEVCV